MAAGQRPCVPHTRSRRWRGGGGLHSRPPPSRRARATGSLMETEVWGSGGCGAQLGTQTPVKRASGCGGAGGGVRQRMRWRPRI